MQADGLCQLCKVVRHGDTQAQLVLLQYECAASQRYHNRNLGASLLATVPMPALSFTYIEVPQPPP